VGFTANDYVFHFRIHITNSAELDGVELILSTKQKGGFNEA